MDKSFGVVVFSPVLVVAVRRRVVAAAELVLKRKDVVQALEKVGRKQRYEIFGN